MKYNLVLTATLLCLSPVAFAQTTAATIKKANLSSSNPTNAEIFTPVPNVVTPAKTPGAAPSDAIVLFDGKNLYEWQGENQSAAGWKVANGVVTVDKTKGDIETKRKFTSFQLHIEWRIPAYITGQGQARGNSGIFLQGRYEIQVLDNYHNDNKTYTNGMAASVYREAIPLANPAKKPGEWNVYDIAYSAPEFNDDSTLKTPARVTVLFNGVMVQNNQAIQGFTSTDVKHVYVAHGPAALRLQSHGDASEPISYRNIWIRE